MDDPGERVTVGFTLAALERLKHPAAVFAQTRGWARSVGIVSDRPVPAQTGFARREGIDYGFHSGPRGLLESLPAVRVRPEHEADRYVLIGTEEDPEAVAARGWEYLTIEAAAEAAAWRLHSSADEDRGWP